MTFSLPFKETSSFQCLAIVCELFRMVKWPEIKGCWWPPTLGNIFRSLRSNKTSVPQQRSCTSECSILRDGEPHQALITNTFYCMFFFNQIPPPDSYRAIGVKIPFAKKNLKNTQRHTDTPPFDWGGQLKKNKPMKTQKWREKNLPPVLLRKPPGIHLTLAAKNTKRKPAKYTPENEHDFGNPHVQ